MILEYYLQGKIEYHSFDKEDAKGRERERFIPNSLHKSLIGVPKHIKKKKKMLIFFYLILHLIEPP